MFETSDDALDHRERRVLRKDVDRKTPQPWQMASLHEELDRIEAGGFVDAFDEELHASEARALRGAVVRFVGGSRPWGAPEAQYDPLAGTPCPGCGDRPLPFATMCLVCSASHATRKQYPSRSALDRLQERVREKARRRKALEACGR
jgi:hypothetical protein